MKIPIWLSICVLALLLALLACTLSMTAPTIMPTTELATPARTPEIWKVNSPALHIRACAAVSCENLGFLERGQRVNVEKCLDGWAFIGRGWVYAAYLSPEVCK